MSGKNTNEKNTTRRNVLKSGGAITGINLLGIVPAEAQPDTETHIVEAGYEYDVDESVDSMTMPIVHEDFSPPYHVDHAHRRVVTNPYAEDRASSESDLIDNSFVIRAKGNVTNEKILFSDRTDVITYSLEPDFRRTYKIQLTEPIYEDSVEIKKVDSSIKAEANGVTKTIQNNEEIRTELPPKEVIVTTKRVLGDPIEDDTFPDYSQPLATEEEEKTISVTPNLRVRNLGKFSIQVGEQA